MTKQLVSTATFLFMLLAFVAPRANAGLLPQKEWTMMVYLNGNNDLDRYGAININQMEVSGSNENRNIVVQWASLAERTTKRLYVQKDNDRSTVTSPVVEVLGTVDMGHKQNLSDFIEWSVKNFPAKKYFVVVWNHGTGWHLTGSKERGSFGLTDISSDDRTGNSIKTEELADVLRQAARTMGHPVDLYASDACLMSMVEVAYQMQGAVETFAGSEETEPGDGWPYDTFLSKWAQKPKASSLEVGKMLADAYDDFYKNSGSQQSTFSVLKMSALPQLVRAMGALGRELKMYSDKASLRKRAGAAIRFFSFDYVDIGNLMKELSKLPSNAALKSAIANVNAALKSTVFYNRANVDAHGVSVWWPLDNNDWKQHNVRYEKLFFNRASGWHSFLKSMF